MAAHRPAKSSRTEMAKRRIKLGLAAAVVGVLAVLVPGLAGAAQATGSTYEVAFVDQCDGTVDVTLSNNRRTGPLWFKVNGERVGVDPGAEVTIADVPGHEADPVEVLIHWGGRVWKPAADPHTWVWPQSCPPVDVTDKQTCDGFTVTVTNPAGAVPVEAVFSVKGDEQDPVVVEPGATASQGIENPADGDVIAVSVYGSNPYTFTYATPDGCVTASPEPTPTGTAPPAGAAGGGQLPLTGVKAGGVAAAGALLLVGGVALTAVRRRRPRFTAG
jgi:LPXTG-motif cell wall-anchored protein